MSKQRGFLIAILLGTLSTLPALASQPLPNYTIHVHVRNFSANGAWLTAYRREIKDVIVDSWCVSPNQTVDRQFGKGRAPYKVTVEVKALPNCHGHTIKRWGDDLNWNYCCTEFWFRRTLSGSDNNVIWR